MASQSLPKLPVAHFDLPVYIAQNPDKPMIELLQPYRDYEAHLRGVYAQDRQNPILDDPYLNVVPLFTENTKHVATRARNLASESDEEKSKYVMPLPDDKRRPHGSPATVADLGQFQNNFNVFSESSLVDMDWSNVVAAGSSVVNCLLPVPREFDTTKRKLREYYHEKFCPASDVDLFLYGLSHDQAIEKIKKIEQAVKDALLNEVTVVRTKYALTIASQYPVRHVQIVLRVYKSVSEILTGFDIDAAGGAYDGKQVYVTPRALGSFITQINHVDLTRRSPSYENRLSKYSHRNFEVYWPDLDRSRIDPTIYERSFQRTLGLARLLVLERLPTSSARDTYLNKRREERGRPTVHRGFHHLGGNLKDHHEDEVSDWLSEEEISNYHTFTVPYGQHFNAKKIEKLCYTRDLLLNAEWNQPKEREIYLHRHPAFFGRVEDIVEDCCGTCPTPVTPEEKEIAEKEAEIYISGKISFLIDNPGRQQIGSFNPLTQQDWTDMAYIGNTARLCQSIVDCDVEDVQNWLSHDEADANQRDYTGRTPLHLAVMTSTPEIVRCLIDHGVRITARLADGKTALHLAASRGNVEMVKMLMDKSMENEEAEYEKQAKRRKLASAVESAGLDTQSARTSADEQGKDSDEESDVDMLDAPTETDNMSMTTSSFVKVKDGQDNEHNDDPVPEESDDEPDYYNIDVLGWDVPCSPLHLAIVEGHEDVIKELCEYGADSILPVKFLNKDDPDESKAILTLTLALSLPLTKAKSMTELLLKLGATSSQADVSGCTALHRFVHHGSIELLEILEMNDARGFKTAINHLFFAGSRYYRNAISPLETAISKASHIMVLKLLNGGALSQIDYDTWLKSAKVSLSSDRLSSYEHNKAFFNQSVEQPLLVAIRRGEIDVALKLLENGADPNSLPHDTIMLIENEYRRNWSTGSTPLDMVKDFSKSLRGYKGERLSITRPRPIRGMDSYLSKLEKGTYTHWMVSQDIARAKKTYSSQKENYEKARRENSRGTAEKKAFIHDIIQSLDKLEVELKRRGGKTFADLRPDIKTTANNRNSVDFGPDQAADEPEPVDYQYELGFSGDKELTETRRQGYIDLMEAAWRGDLEVIKAMTVQGWGPERKFAPLKMAINDSQGNSPFSIAFHKRKYDLAKTILEIVQTQWSPEEEEKLRYKLASETYDEDDEYDEGDSAEYSDEDSNDPEPRIVSQKADKNFTIDNIGQVSVQVKSHTTPLQVLVQACNEINVSDDKMQVSTGSRCSLFVQCLKSEDTVGLKFLLDVAQQFAGRLSVSAAEDVDEENSKERFNFPDGDFAWAVAKAQPQLLGMVIKRTGAGIPLEHLVKKSGIEIKHKPRYYQGLTVYGKKRKDWAAAGRNMTVRTSGSQTPPLLLAAIGGNQDNVEFFLSDSPHRYYSEFAKSKAGREDNKLKHLKESSVGFDRAISKWLGADNELVTHCAVLAAPCTESESLLKYLVDTCPSATEKRLASGDTPLMVACRLGRPHYIKILIDGNADQSVRNHHGENVLHALLSKVPSAHRLKQCLDLLDPALRASLFLQRKNLSENGLTPLHYWVCRAAGASMESLGELQNRSRRHYYYNSPEKPYSSEATILGLLELLLDYSRGEELDMLNGAGDTPLHTAVMHGSASMVRILINAKPSLLQRENAVGRTPMEVAHDRLVSQRLSDKGLLFKNNDRELGNILSEHPSKYIKDDKDDGAAETQEQTSAALKKFGLSSTQYAVEDHATILHSLGVWDQKPLFISQNLGLRVIWDLCLTSASQHPEKRRLVSLNEANDVAKRLGESYTQSRYFSVRARSDDDNDDKNNEEEHKSTDFPTTMWSQKEHYAWTVPDHLAQQSGWERCKECDDYHE